MKRRAVSPVIAELLLIVITVAIGTLVYSFASTAFGGFGAGFSNVVADAGQTLAENVVVEQTYFFANATGGTMYVLNAGISPVMIETIFMTDVTMNSQVMTVHFSVALPNTIAPGVSEKIVFSYSAYSTQFTHAYAFTLVTARGNQFIAYEEP